MHVSKSIASYRVLWHPPLFTLSQLCVQRAIQTARGAAKPLLITLLTGVDKLFATTQQAACLEVLATQAEVFGEVKNAPDIAEAQKLTFASEQALGRGSSLGSHWAEEATAIATCRRSSNLFNSVRHMKMRVQVQVCYVGSSS